MEIIWRKIRKARPKPWRKPGVNPVQQRRKISNTRDSPKESPWTWNRTWLFGREMEAGNIQSTIENLEINRNLSEISRRNPGIDHVLSARKKNHRVIRPQNRHLTTIVWRKQPGNRAWSIGENTTCGNCTSLTGGSVVPKWIERE